MQACRFDNFQLLPENRAAFDRCERVANLEEGVAAPLILMGGPGQGKTHLLWAIVNQVREQFPHTALALITPREFPMRVRQLARNPEPIQKSRHAILLVDGLAHFREDAADLEGVITAFLDNHFSVVLATNRPPIQIESFSIDFRRRLTGADMVTLGGQPGHSGGRTVSGRPPAMQEGDARRVVELESRCATLLTERDAAATRLERNQRRVVQLEEEIAALLQKYAALEGSERQARDASRELVRLQGEYEAMRVEVDTARAERDSVRASIRQLEADNRQLREELGRDQDLPLQLTQAREERDAAQEEAAALRDTVSHLDVRLANLGDELASERAAREHLQGTVDAMAGMEEALLEAQRSCEHAQEETRRIAEQAAAILDHLIVTHPETSDSSNEPYALIAEFLERLREQRSTADLTISDRLEAIVAGQESAAQRALRAELAELASEREMQASLFEEALAGQARLDVELGLTQGRLREMQRERDVARQTRALALTELDALRDQSREELAAARRDLAAMRWHIEAIARHMAGAQPTPDSLKEFAAALAALATPAGISAAPAAAPEDEPQLFEEVPRGRSLLQEISRQLAEAGRAPGEAPPAPAPTSLAQAVDDAFSWNDDGNTL